MEGRCVAHLTSLGSAGLEEEEPGGEDRCVLAGDRGLDRTHISMSPRTWKCDEATVLLACRTAPFWPSFYSTYFNTISDSQETFKNSTDDSSQFLTQIPQFKHFKNLSISLSVSSLSLSPFSFPSPLLPSFSHPFHSLFLVLEIEPRVSYMPGQRPLSYSPSLHNSLTPPFSASLVPGILS